jgi:hypothetical protein
MVTAEFEMRVKVPQTATETEGVSYDDKKEMSCLVGDWNSYVVMHEKGNERTERWRKSDEIWIESTIRDGMRCRRLQE